MISVSAGSACRACVEEAGQRRSAGQLAEQGLRAFEHVRHCRVVDAALEAVARFGVQPVAARAAAHPARG